MIISGSGSGKTNALLNLISQQDDIDKIYLQAKDLGESKYQFLIGKLEIIRIKHLNGQKHLLSVQILWMMLMRTLMITTQQEKEKCLLIFIT